MLKRIFVSDYEQVKLGPDGARDFIRGQGIDPNGTIRMWESYDPDGVWVEGEALPDSPTSSS